MLSLSYFRAEHVRLNSLGIRHVSVAEQSFQSKPVNLEMLGGSSWRVLY